MGATLGLANISRSLVSSLWFCVCWPFLRFLSVVAIIFPSSKGLQETALRAPWVGRSVEPRWQRHQLRKHLAEATSYEQFRRAAQQLDILDGKEDWKMDERSEHYDWQTVKTRLELLRGLYAKRDCPALLLALRGGLRRNLAGIGAPQLHNYCHSGTKYLIRDYVAEVIKQLEYICDEDIPDFDDRQKLNFFLETRQSFGRTALMLSGGVSLGLYHFGVLKALFEQKRLPRVVSGSSVGALVAALLCTRTDDELPELFDNRLEDTEAFEHTQTGSLERRVRRFLTKGVLFDIRVLENVMKQNLGEYTTFKEAFDRTGRILNITVASTTQFEVPLLLNYLTHPNVLIWSAACASCAMQGLYEPVELMAKDATGTIRLYQPAGIKWSHGNVENNLPMMRLAELFNINHSIVSQVNPHVVPFFSARSRESKAFTMLKYLIESELRHRITQVAELGIFPNFTKLMQPLIAQPFQGDITIVPSVSLKDYVRILNVPTEEYRQRCISEGKRSVWPKLSLIRTNLDVELCLERCLNRVRRRLLQRDQAAYGAYLLRNAHNIHHSDLILTHPALTSPHLRTARIREGSAEDRVDGAHSHALALPSSGSTTAPAEEQQQPLPLFIARDGEGLAELEPEIIYSPPPLPSTSPSSFSSSLSGVFVSRLPIPSARSRSPSPPPPPSSDTAS